MSGTRRSTSKSARYLNDSGHLTRLVPGTGRYDTLTLFPCLFADGRTANGYSFFVRGAARIDRERDRASSGGR